MILNESLNFDFIDTLQELAIEDDNRRYPHFFMTFTDVLKLGIKPTAVTSWSDPLGIYGFPISPYRDIIMKFKPYEWKKVFDFFRKIDVSKFHKRNYVIFFTLKDFSKVWYLSDGFNKYKRNLFRYIDNLDIDEEEKHTIKTDIKQILKGDPYDLYSSLHDIFVYDLIPLIDKRPEDKKQMSRYDKVPAMLNKIFRSIGIDAIVDNIGYRLNDYEKYQIVVLNPLAVKTVKAMDNPLKPYSEKYDFFHNTLEEIINKIPFENEKDFEFLKSEKFKKFLRIIKELRRVDLHKEDWEFLYKWLGTPGLPEEKKKEFFKNIYIRW